MQLTQIADNVDFLTDLLDSMFKPREQFRPDDVQACFTEIFAADEHAKRVS